MICNKTICLLIYLAVVFGLFTLSYDLVVIEDQSGVMKVLATSGDDSEDSAGNSDDTNPDDTNPDDTNPDDNNPSSSEDNPDDLPLECSSDMELIDGECRKVGSASDIANSSIGGDSAASSPGVISGSEFFTKPPTADELSSPGSLSPEEMPPHTWGVETPQNEYSQPDNDKFHLNSEDIALELTLLPHFKLENILLLIFLTMI